MSSLQTTNIELQVAPSGGHHPAMPRTPEEIAADAAACVAAGATQFHLHAYDDDGAETLEGGAVARVLTAVRRACPGVLLNMTTFASIVPDPTERLRLVEGWHVLPDLVAANQGEAGIDDVSASLMRRGVGMEACVMSVLDAEVLIRRGGFHRFSRLVIEPLIDDGEAAAALVDTIQAMARTAGVTLPQLHHGIGRATWHVARRAVAGGHSIRVGLEDGEVLEDGSPAGSNAELAAAAAVLIRDTQHA